MSELKLLDDRIKNLTVGLLGLAEGQTMQVGKSFLESVRGYMVELLALRRTQPENEPHGLLTAWETHETCPNCLEHLSIDWSFCPECGRPTDWADIGYPITESEPLTNAQRIRGMSDEELEDGIRKIGFGYKPWCALGCVDNCNRCLLDWLQQQAETEE